MSHMSHIHAVVSDYARGSEDADWIKAALKARQAKKLTRTEYEAAIAPYGWVAHAIICARLPRHMRRRYAAKYSIPSGAVTMALINEALDRQLGV